MGMPIVVLVEDKVRVAQAVERRQDQGKGRGDESNRPKQLRLCRGAAHSGLPKGRALGGESTR